MEETKETKEKEKRNRRNKKIKKQKKLVGKAEFRGHFQDFPGRLWESRGILGDL